MATVSTYLNFDGTCEEAFAFYREVFGGEYAAPLQRIGEVPQGPDAPPLAEGEADRVMHVALDIMGGHRIHGSDTLPSMGHLLVTGNNTYLNLQVDTEEELRELFDGLSAGGAVEMEPTPMFWGDLYCAFTDRYGLQWMIVTALEEEMGHA